MTIDNQLKQWKSQDSTLDQQIMTLTNLVSDYNENIFSPLEISKTKKIVFVKNIDGAKEKFEMTFVVNNNRARLLKRFSDSKE